MTVWFEGRAERPPPRPPRTSKEMFMDVTPQHDVSQNTATPATNGQLFC